MLQNAYFLAKIGTDTAENEQHFAEIFPKIGNYPTGAAHRGPGLQAEEPRPAATRRVHGAAHRGPVVEHHVTSAAVRHDPRMNERRRTNLLHLRKMGSRYGPV